MTRSEAARHAALVRYGKEAPFAARLAAIRQARQHKGGKGKKPAATPEQRDAKKRAAQTANVNTVGDKLDAADMLAGADAYDNGSDVDPKIQKDMVAAGLGEMGKDGSFRLSSTGREALSAARRGDIGAAKDALSRGKDGVAVAGERAAAGAARQAAQDQRKQAMAQRDAERVKKQAEKEKAKAKASGGGGKGGSKEPTTDKATQRIQERADNRSGVQAALEQSAGASLNPIAFDAITQFADGNDPNPEILGALADHTGLIERDSSGGYRMTPEGRQYVSAADKGNSRAASDAMSRAMDKVNAKTPAPASADTQPPAPAEPGPNQQVRLDKREAGRVRRRLHIAKNAKKALMSGSLVEWLDDQRADFNLAEHTKDLDMPYSDILDSLTPLSAALAELGDAAIKAGARHSGGDQAILQQIFEAANEIEELAVALGADPGDDVDEGDEPDDTEEGGTVEMVEGKGIEIFSTEGGAIKALDGDSIGGYAVLFGAPDMHDLSQQRDYFTKSTDFWLTRFGWPRPITYHHGMDPDTANDPIVGEWKSARIDDVGVWMEGQLDKAHKYHTAVKELIRRGYLKLSSDSAPQWVQRERNMDTGANEVKRWPLITASTTVTPAEPRMAALSLKALMADLGLDDIDDNQEANEPSDSDRHDGAKADDDRARVLLLELDLLSLEATP